MLIFELDNRTAIPVRAIPLITGGTFDAHQIIDLFYDPEPWADGPEIRRLPQARLYRPESKELHDDVPAARWELPKVKSRHLPKGPPDGVDQLGLLPGGVFVWLDEFKVFYDSVTEQEWTGQPMPAGALGWVLDPFLSADTEKMVWEGFAWAANGSGPERERGAAKTDACGIPVGFEVSEADASEIPIRAIVERKLTPGQQDKSICKTLAKRLWDKDPDMSQAEVLRTPAFAPYHRKYKDRKTLRSWIREVDPRPPGERLGRRRKR